MEGCMKKGIVLAVIMAWVLSFAGAALAAPADDAQALVKKAVAMAKEKGIDETLKVVADKSGALVNGDFYIFAVDMGKLTLVAHPMAPQLVGKDQSGMKDVKGKMFFVEFVNLAKNPGSGWVDYYWPKPGADKTPVLKSTYIERVPGTDIMFGCGFYK
jgi:signal transduction histidine kinase